MIRTQSELIECNNEVVSIVRGLVLNTGIPNRLQFNCCSILLLGSVVGLPTSLFLQLRLLSGQVRNPYEGCRARILYQAEM